VGISNQGFAVYWTIFDLRVSYKTAKAGDVELTSDKEAMSKQAEAVAPMIAGEVVDRLADHFCPIPSLPTNPRVVCLRNSLGHVIGDHAPVELPVGPLAILLSSAYPIGVIVVGAALQGDVRRPGTFPIASERQLCRALLRAAGDQSDEQESRENRVVHGSVDFRVEADLFRGNPGSRITSPAPRIDHRRG
jgi:hypothetical protein